MTKPNLSSLASKLDGHNKVKIAITDIDGVLRGKYMHTEKFLSAVEKGFGFCNVVFGWDSNDTCYGSNDFSGWHNGYQDILAKPIGDSLRQIPWDDNVPMFLADFWTANHTPLAVCPRQVLAKIQNKAESLGFKAQVGVEFEWFNFKETPESLSKKSFQHPTPISTGMFGYSLLRSSMNREFFHQIMDWMQAIGIPLEGLHTETGPGVYEAALQCCSPLEAADRSVLFKGGVKEIAAQHGIMASFMARWNNQLPGTSGHMHQSLVDIETNQPVFYSNDDHQGMSSIFKSYLAGQIHCLPKLLPMLAPTINSYKRLVDGYWAPTSMSWGIDNRTCALRVLSGSKSSTRVEVRVAGADMNPYLAIAASLGAGLYGIEHNLKLEQLPISGNAYEAENCVKFSRNLERSTKIFSDSGIAQDLFGEEFVRHFTQTREWEWEQFQKTVTKWELERYFEII